MEETTVHHGHLSFSALTCGLEHGASAPLVLCLHGFPDHAATFRHQLPALATAGYRVVAPTMRGYEPSSQPADGDYQLTTLAGDVLAWLDELDAREVHLVGHDWGAALAYTVGALAPERFTSLTAMAVPPPARMAKAVRKLPVQVAKSWYMFFFQLRGLSDWALGREDWALVERLWRRWSPSYRLSDNERAALRATFERPGVRQAMLEYYRQNASFGFLLGLRPSRSPRRVDVRTLAITGADDGCIDTRLFDLAFRVGDFPAGYRIARLPGVGHFAHLERPEAVNTLLLEWFDAGSSQS